MKKRIVINRHNIKHNKNNTNIKPVISIQTYKEIKQANEISIQGKIKVVYSPTKPLKCGATVWIETDDDVVIIR